ncbi:MAG: leucine-rich repeat domain-containing protein, partial [Spirochaetia bacterium]|nr:leucine-rich repeat domain-containing protein [Spirochaetia bacterium]
DQLLELANFDQKRANRQTTFHLTEENLEGLDEVLHEEFGDEEDSEDEESEEDTLDDDPVRDLNVLDAIRISEYGNLGVPVDFSLVGPDIEEAILPGMGIVDLDGVSELTNLRVLDASDNRLVDIDELSNLDKLEEFFCANNRVADISLLSCCENLRIVDVSNNQILDVSSLISLPRLEFANLCGNRIPKSQIQLLRSKGVEVIEG